MHNYRILNKKKIYFRPQTLKGKAYYQTWIYTQKMWNQLKQGNNPVKDNSISTLSMSKNTQEKYI